MKITDFQLGDRVRRSELYNSSLSFQTGDEGVVVGLTDEHIRVEFDFISNILTPNYRWRCVGAIGTYGQYGGPLDALEIIREDTPDDWEGEFELE